MDFVWMCIPNCRTSNFLYWTNSLIHFHFIVFSSQIIKQDWMKEWIGSVRFAAGKVRVFFSSFLFFAIHLFRSWLVCNRLTPVFYSIRVLYRATLCFSSSLQMPPPASYCHSIPIKLLFKLYLNRVVANPLRSSIVWVFFLLSTRVKKSFLQGELANENNFIFEKHEN